MRSLLRMRTMQAVSGRASVPIRMSGKAESNGALSAETVKLLAALGFGVAIGAATTAVLSRASKTSPRSRPRIYPAPCASPPGPKGKAPASGAGEDEIKKVTSGDLLSPSLLAPLPIEKGSGGASGSGSDGAAGREEEMPAGAEQGLSPEVGRTLKRANTQHRLSWSKQHFDGGDKVAEHTVEANQFAVDRVLLFRVPDLRDKYPDQDQAVENCRRAMSDVTGSPIKYRNIIGGQHCILGDIVRNSSHERISRGFVRAGPRSELYFKPTKVRAAVVTCGGLCPGLNDVIREITRSLIVLYGAEKVFGVRNGFNGFHDDTPIGREPLDLTIESTLNIHQYGGSILACARGGYDHDAIFGWCEKRGINQLYIIGGDGTHRGATALLKAAEERSSQPMSIIGVPKSIDNDIDFIDRTFGFQTAVEAAVNAIHCATTEAKCAPNGIGVVKVMGRHAGFIAAHATLAAGEVDCCLVPEVPVKMDGKEGVLCHLEQCIEEQGHAVLVVAEGAGEELLKPSSDEVDAGGHHKLPPIGDFIVGAIKAHFKKIKTECNVKYIDPSYIVRSVPANASDSTYGMLLGQNAVHAAMAGFTGATVGLVNNRMVLLPITAVTETSPRVMRPTGRTWERVISMTRQPNLARPLSENPKGAKSSRGGEVM